MRTKKGITPTLSDIDIRLLHVFRAVTESKGFANAETVLNIGRSTISAQMATLEGRLGLRLCERGPGGFSLTDEGREVYAASTRLLMALNEFRTDVDKAHGHEYINFALIDNTITDSASPVFDALTRYTNNFSNVHIRISTFPAQEIEKRIGQGRIDLGLVAQHGETPGLVYEPLYKEKNLLYCGRDHPWFSLAMNDGDPIKVTELRHVSHGYKHTPLERVSNFGLSRDATAYSVEGIAMFVLTGQYVGFLPTHYASSWVARNEMRPIYPERYFFDTDIAIVYQNEVCKKQGIKEFLREILAGT